MRMRFRLIVALVTAIALAPAALAQTLADQAEAFDFEAAVATLKLLRSELQP